MICSECGHKNRAGVLICDDCGSDIYDILVGEVETKELGENRARELHLGEPASSRPLILYVADGQAPISVKRLNNLIVGRKGSEDTTSEDVNVDLSPFNAQEHGVSRQHAQLDAEKSPPVLIDLGSYNGTYINGERIEAKTPSKVKSGDELQLGRLKMRIYYK